MNTGADVFLSRLVGIPDEKLSESRCAMTCHEPHPPSEEGPNHFEEGPKPPEELVGNTTKHALLTLYEELLTEVQLAEEAQRSRKFSEQLYCFNHKNVKSVLHWTSFLILFVLAIFLLIGYGYRHIDLGKSVYQSCWWIAEALLILLSLLFNGYLIGWNQTLVIEEPVRLAQEALVKIRENLVDGVWNTKDYLNLNSPQSPCISTQWTYRDGELVDLPTVLMVKGDVILLRPGHAVPVQCQELMTEENQTGMILCEGDVYTPNLEHSVEQFGLPQGRVPLQPKKFTVLKTPFVENLRNLLDKTGDHPASIVDSIRYQVHSVLLEKTLLPVVLFGVLIVNTLRYIYIKGFIGHWTEMFLVLPVHAVLPLVPMIFPFFWKLLNYYGQARLFVAYEVSKEIKPSVSEESFDSDSIISEDEARVNLPWKRVLHWLMVIATGNSPVATYNINLMHILGSVTTLCCVDKKGILSWPNPSAEKVFFFSDVKQPTQHNSPQDSLCSFSEEMTFSQYPEQDSTQDCAYHGEEAQVPTNVPRTGCHVEVLDLTHDTKNSFGLQFDDPSWKIHLSSLKPLGLNILANTCNTSTANWYSQFTDHVASAALEDEGTVAVLNRRCLCELARQIGFSNNALDIFSKKQIIGVYRQVLEERAAKERLQRARSNVRHRIPMPNLVSIVVKEKNSGMFQLLCQGTADLILDCCSDYWNGQDLCPLTDSDRKKVLDFYHRTSIASYCTAFSYRPLTTQITSPLKDMYIELPADSSAMCQIQNVATRVNESVKMDSSKLTKQPWCFSADSLVTENDGPYSSDSVPACFQMQCSQIFIGMVSMQYQARLEFVQMIDKLETAFIRFVHFSNENELRSRVFSEKMGLEAGWNCHISLASPIKSEELSVPGTSQGELSHRTSKYSSRHSNDTIGRESHAWNTKMKQQQQQQHHHPHPAVGESLHTRCYSAPSVINLDMCLVKFDDTSSTNQTNGDMPTFCINPDFPKEIVIDRDSLLGENMDDSTELLANSSATAPAATSVAGTPVGGAASSSDCNDGSGEPCSESHLTSSCETENTEFSLPGVPDNRAQLPRGIENIRPHLEKVDNVPLLVNLFTDCTPETTKEMIKIMQEYGEVVLCVGSSLNVKNTGLFLQADCSLAIEPLYPQLCRSEPLNIEPGAIHAHLTPMHLASSLLSSPCPLLFRNHENISLIQLIAEARNHVLSMGNCFKFLLCCHLSLTLVQVLATLILLPPPLSGHQLLWLIFIVVPLLSLSLMGNPVDPRNMTLATAKNCDHINKQMLLHFVLSFIFRFVPPVTVALITFALILYFICDVFHESQPCYPFDLSQHNPSGLWNSWYGDNSAGFTTAQNIVLFQMVLYFVFISGSFVHRSDHIWKEPPYTNCLWLVIVICILIFQLIFFLCDTGIYGGFQKNWLSHIHPAIWVISFIWPLVTLAFSELVKRYEIKLNVRYQKRAHLAFETKLGMNSPF